MIIKSMKHSIMTQYGTCIRNQDALAFGDGRGRGREVDMKDEQEKRERGRERANERGRHYVCVMTK